MGAHRFQSGNAFPNWHISPVPLGQRGAVT
jgi:hypothetical protein